MLIVKSTDRKRVGAWEKNPAHKGGECFVAGEEECKVGDTPFIRDRIAKGFLTLVREVHEETEEPQPTTRGKSRGRSRGKGRTARGRSARGRSTTEESDGEEQPAPGE